ncbi:DUF4147 domain-containing protein [Nitrosopumilus sp.]|uniref:glycerate kinase type-2 family protein n=1 Tax=Nitrosopumilus sp. TaxID=2024843 RepID=UPI0026386806|nr:DUF4147 domain-containing protein [Nitrosopumilus sp.]
MIIQNFEDLALNDKKKDCLEILDAGLQAANPKNILSKFVTPTEIKIGDKSIKFSDYSSVYTVAFGKAGDSMTQALNAIFPVKNGIIVIPKGSKSIVKGKKFQIFNPRHPKPDQTSVKAAKEVMKFVQNRKSDELIVFLVSGGASSLLALPDQITLDDKIHVTDLMLKSGATIQEFNCVRKHLSKIKGGKLVQDMKCSGVGLIMSDVERDDMSSIASGTTYMDNTTYNDALEIIDKYKLKRKMPLEVMQLLKKGLENNEEVPKKPKIDNIVIANNESCLIQMKKAAEKKGYNVSTIQVFGEIKNVVTEILENIPTKQKQCLIFGGEPTVKVLGKGTGGRNQELVLRLLKNTQKEKKLVIASMGTDGIDGNSVFAGAITENVKIDLLTMKEFLKNSDSARFFQKQKANIVTNFTHTNLMDIGVILS